MGLIEKSTFILNEIFILGKKIAFFLILMFVHMELNFSTNFLYYEGQMFKLSQIGTSILNSKGP